MRPPKYLQNVLVGASALVFAGAKLVSGHGEPQNGPVLNAAIAAVTAAPAPAPASPSTPAPQPVEVVTKAALDAFAGVVRPLSRPEALETAFHSYYAYKAAHPDDVKKPLLYFVDYGLSNTEPRGYVFDMDAMKVVEGPFTVAHGRGSSGASDGVPTRFSNAPGSAATSLGLYVAKSLYSFVGHTGGSAYSSVGMRLQGVSTGFNDLAFMRGVVAHGAPYVTAHRAGRSEGCPAMDESRAARLLPKLADGGMVFLFAPDQKWLTKDPWVGKAG